jgi:hypothetical protein
LATEATSEFDGEWNKAPARGHFAAGEVKLLAAFGTLSRMAHAALGLGCLMKHALRVWRRQSDVNKLGVIGETDVLLAVDYPISYLLPIEATHAPSPREVCITANATFANNFSQSSNYKVVRVGSMTREEKIVATWVHACEGSVAGVTWKTSPSGGARKRESSVEAEADEEGVVREGAVDACLDHEWRSSVALQGPIPEGSIHLMVSSGLGRCRARGNVGVTEMP